MYVLHTYLASDGYRWGVVAENHTKLGHGGQGYSNQEDMEKVLLKMFLPARKLLTGVSVPWSDCFLHESKNGKCYMHKLTDPRVLLDPPSTTQQGQSPGEGALGQPADDV